MSPNARAPAARPKSSSPPTMRRSPRRSRRHGFTAVMTRAGSRVRHRPHRGGRRAARLCRRCDRRQRAGRRAADRAGVDQRRRAATREPSRCGDCHRLCMPARRGRGTLRIPTSSRSCSTQNGYALYFSRAPIPYARDAFAGGIATPAARACRCTGTSGIYAYRVPLFSRRYARLAPAPLEHFEALEQLRALWHGHRISLAITPAAPHAGVDTAADLARVRTFLDSSR